MLSVNVKSTSQVHSKMQLSLDIPSIFWFALFGPQDGSYAFIHIFVLTPNNYGSARLGIVSPCACNALHLCCAT